jgi:uncharacterized protein with FMN-binding domain
VKKLGIFICAIMIMSLLGCNTKPKTSTNQGVAQNTPAKSGTNTTTAKYKDGTYTGLSDKWKYGQESATIIIKNGKMTYINLKRLDLTGKEVNYNDWVGKKQANGEIKPNLKKFRVDMAREMISYQTYQVDTIASATVSTGGWKLAAQRALDKAK